MGGKVGGHGVGDGAGVVAVVSRWDVAYCVTSWEPGLWGLALLGKGTSRVLRKVGCQLCVRGSIVNGGGTGWLGGNGEGAMVPASAVSSSKGGVARQALKA